MRLFFFCSKFKFPLVCRVDQFLFNLLNLSFKFVTFLLFIFQLIDHTVRMKFHLLFDFNVVSHVSFKLLNHLFVFFRHRNRASFTYNSTVILTNSTWNGSTMPNLFELLCTLNVRKLVSSTLMNLILILILPFALKLLTSHILFHFNVHQNLNTCLNVVDQINWRSIV